MEMYYAFYRYFVKWPTLLKYDSQIVADNWELFGRFAKSLNNHLWDKDHNKATAKSIRRWEAIENGAISECIPM